MPIPSIPSGTTARGQAVNDLLEACALQSAALAGLLVAQQEAWRAALAAPNLDAGQAAALSERTQRLLEAVTALERLGQRRLRLLESHLRY